MFTLLAWLFTLPCLIGAVTFAYYNADSIPVVISPFRDAVQMPAYAPVLAGVAFGFFFGALMTWAAMGRLRKQRREQAKQIKTLEKQLAAVEQPAPVSTPPSSSPFLMIGRKSK